LRVPIIIQIHNLVFLTLWSILIASHRRTYIYIDSVYSTGQPEPGNVVYTPEGEVSVWQVQDTGRGPNLSQYWLDFYLKYAPEATKFGKGKVTYHY